MSLIPVELQQLLLNIFKDAFATRLDSDIHPLLQEVKGHLYNRDFATAFGRNDYLEAYAARWSPSRALGYAQVLAQMKELADGAQSSILSGGKIVCLGGGAGAEIVALGGFLNLLQRSKSRDDSPPQLEVVAVDIADWSQVVTKLHQNITTAPTLSKYASAAVKEANAPLLGPGQINVTFQQHDVLNADIPVLSSLLHGAILVTIMFTLNELYSTSLPLTQRFLLNLTACLPAGALLLVVDSPGSYSSVSLNGAEKKYPMQWLLDHTLLKEDPKTDAVAWKKITEDESQWFRLESTLRYPIELEHMRFQLHLYKRTG
jgi:25S rRNA (uracil2843-N3)-methyltransferase